MPSVAEPKKDAANKRDEEKPKDEQASGSADKDTQSPEAGGQGSGLRMKPLEELLETKPFLEIYVYGKENIAIVAEPMPDDEPDTPKE